MKKEEKKHIFKNMQKLGLSALAHANRMDPSEKWDELSVLLTAHATEILIKAKIAQEHPLLIFENFPKTNDNELSLSSLFYEGHTIEWSSLPNMLWAITNTNLDRNQKDAFKNFGNLRNGIQHFGAVPKDNSGMGIAYMRFVEFIYSFIDPLIYKWWKLYAVDYSQDYNEDIDPEENETYWDYIREYLVQYQIEFTVSPRLAMHTDLWWDKKKDETDIRYQKIIQKQIDKQISQP
jgi:hypothetical protein